MKKIPLYPLKFRPILLEKVWGGSKLKNQFNKEAKGLIGESWELSGVNENVSITANGPLEGQSLNQLISTYKGDLLGERVYKVFGNEFPLLFKFIDAAQDLSVQLHPDDKLAKERHNTFGKTEMWYIMEAENNARLILGLKENTTEEIYEAAIKSNKITDILAEKSVQKGDSYFIAPGTTHAIGAGIVLAEIQQTSDITYRIYDWDRPDLDGKMRQLHTNEAKEAINFQVNVASLTSEPLLNKPVLLKKSDYFETNKLVLDSVIHRDLKAKDSFVVYMCVEGDASIKAGGISERIKTGETLLIPHRIASIEIATNSATLLEVYIP
ncbi:type I phosphomannose isomerase catalytic subunit [Patiriisocius marinus]|uniref:Phosphohexomutase n=1 Tax=Patiriisocius marinus TaxID=1397112 RepID=A0A5J4J345_9FLAO|nr:type I phosphomannose isomerase catalytic subunit [Patiriisocius marinus]GER60290.1 mannose-6-phosphate isomerase [Patiriisocius marinus]